MHTKWVALIFALIAAVGCSCAAGTGADRTIGTQAQLNFADLNGSNFVSDPFTVPGLDIETTIFLQVVDNSVAYRADCNTMGFIVLGSADAAEAQQVQPSSSEIDCTTNQAAVDSWLNSFMTRPPIMNLADGELRLTVDTVTIVMHAR